MLRRTSPSVSVLVLVLVLVLNRTSRGSERGLDAAEDERRVGGGARALHAVGAVGGAGGVGGAGAARGISAVGRLDK